LSLAAVVAIAASAHGTRAFDLARRALSPLLSIPHVAMAVGLAFVIAPSGLLFRIWSGHLGGPPRPPDLLIVNDTWGLSLMAGLLLKEIPFLFLMLLAALPQADAARSLTVARTLGYGRVAAWLKVVLPRVYPQIRLPVLAVLAYGLSVVDVALVLGPTTPPTLPVQILRWINDPDLSFRFRASAGAMLQLGVVVGGIAVWVAGERLVAWLGRRWVEAGSREAGERIVPALTAACGAVGLAVVGLAFVAIALWSVAGAWRYPDVLPAEFTARNWLAESGRAASLVANSALIASITAVVALVLVVGCLENEDRHGRRQAGDAALWLLYTPLLAPQVAFLLGLQVFLIVLRLDETLPAVVLAHLVFVLPYTFLSLRDPWRAVDGRYRQVALTLGASPARALFAIRLPMLLRALLTALAIGWAISVGQYLATLLVSGARLPTITTEAVAVASGGDRRTLAIYALLQTALPFVAFALALLVPGIVFRDRRALRNP
ncbi:MAG: ABC transporter permease subunit, partial [Rhodospirillales bacterium]|nr:ABC transporter permease subunit [Rhodospirillales bacterium]